MWEYILKQEVVVAQTPEWKFKPNIARNATFDIFPYWVKNGKKRIIFKNFTLVSPKVAKLIDNNITFAFQGIPYFDLLGQKCGSQLGQKWQKRSFLYQ